MNAHPPVTSRTWTTAPHAWSTDQRWYAERMTIAGEDWFARIRPGTDASLPPIVMVHGVIVTGTYYRPVANVMDPRYSTYVPDLPGIGQSTSAMKWTLPLWTLHLAGWMDAHELSGAVLIANSFGCQLSTNLAAIRPDLVRSLVLIAPTLNPDITSIPEVIWKSVLVFPRERPSVWATWIPDFLKTGPLRSLRMLRQMFLDDQLARLQKLRQPTVVIGGAWDTISPPAWIRRVASHIPGAQVVIMPDAPHALNYSRPRELIEAIAAAAAGKALP